jgi:hypothetical protein
MIYSNSSIRRVGDHGANRRNIVEEVVSGRKIWVEKVGPEYPFEFGGSAVDASTLG